MLAFAIASETNTSIVSKICSLLTVKQGILMWDVRGDVRLCVCVCLVASDKPLVS